MKTITRPWDYWAYLFRVTHRQTIHALINASVHGGVLP